MEIERLKELSRRGEEEYQEEDLAVTPPSGRSEVKFTLEDINEKFKDFVVRDPLIVLVGSCATQGKGADIDLVMKDDDLPDIIKEAVRFRLLRQMSGEFNIDYDLTSEFLHMHDESHGSYTDYLPLYRLKIERIPNERVHRMSECEILEKGKRFIIAGTVSTTDVDRDMERITEPALKEIWKTLKGTPDEFRGLFDSHSSTQIGKLLWEYKNRKCALINNSQLYLIFELRQDVPVAEEIIKLIKSGEIGGFSIKFGIQNPSENTREICNQDRCVTEITGGVYYLETSITETPSNPNTNIEILSK